MFIRTIITASLLTIVAGMPAPAQEAAPVAEATGPRTFTSAAQARAYLAGNPTGARAESAFRILVAFEIAAAHPDFDAGEVALGRAVVIMPGANMTPEEAQLIVNQTTPGIGARTGWF